MSQTGGAVTSIKVIRRTDSNVKATPASTPSDKDKSCSVGCFSVNGRHSQVSINTGCPRKNCSNAQSKC